MPDLAIDSSVVNDPIVRNGVIVGHICSQQHTRIVHYTLDCPLCSITKLLLSAEEHNARLSDEAHYRQSELESAQDRAKDLQERLDESEQTVGRGGPDGF